MRTRMESLAKAIFDCSECLDIAEETRSTENFHAVENESFLTGKESAIARVGIVEHEEDSASIAPRGWSRLPSWKRGIWLAFLVAVGVLIFLVATTVAFYLKLPPSDAPGLAARILSDGSCKATNNLEVFLHLITNILSTVVLAASSYCLQVASVPTRTELDRAHGERKFVDIGIRSVRNLFLIRKGRKIIVIILFATTLPLHLFFNGAVLSSIGAYDYYYALVTPGFLQGDYWYITAENAPLFSETTFTDYTAASMPWLAPTQSDLMAQSSKWERLSTEECVKAYSGDFSINRGNVVLVTMEENLSNALWRAGFSGAGAQIRQSAWLCGDSSDVILDPEISGWKTRTPGCDAQKISQIDYQNRVFQTLPFYYYNSPADHEGLVQIHYCLSQKLPDHCTVQVSLTTTTILCTIVAIKIILFNCLLFASSCPILTVGDAVASFLETPDTYSATKYACTIGIGQRRKRNPRDGPADTQKDRRLHWRTPAFGFWIGTNVFLFVALVLVSAGFAEGLADIGVAGSSTSFKSLWGLGFGVRGSSLIFLGNGNVAHAKYNPFALLLITNAPQIALALLYLVLNTLMTSMLLSYEWAQYSIKRTGLRVSQPVRGLSQRRTFWLQLPFKYSIPLGIISILLHWTVSSSLFVARVDLARNSSGEPSLDAINTLGFSVIALICVMLLLALLLLVVNSIGWRKLPSSMPVVSTCSIGIAAACHSLNEDGSRRVHPRLATLPLKWGATKVWRSCAAVHDVHMHIGANEHSGANGHSYESVPTQAATEESLQDGYYRHLAFSDVEIDEMRPDGNYE